jgi:hypothetical protein
MVHANGSSPQVEDSCMYLCSNWLECHYLHHNLNVNTALFKVVSKVDAIYNTLVTLAIPLFIRADQIGSNCGIMVLQGVFDSVEIGPHAFQFGGVFVYIYLSFLFYGSH